MKKATCIFLVWLTAATLFFQGDSLAHAQAPTPAVETKSAAQPQAAKEQPKVAQDRVKGSIHHAGGKSEWKRIVGKATVLDAHTLQYEDGTRIPLLMVAPDLGQMAMIEGSLYPCGKEAAEFLRDLIGDRPVTCFFVEAQDKWFGYVGDTNIEHAMIINGWALAHHSGMNAAEIIARENKRGLWRGQFIDPEEWRAGKRLPGENALSVQDSNVRASFEGHTAAGTSLQSTVVRDRVPGSFISPGAGLHRIAGKVKVLNAHTLAFDDGTEIELNGGMDAPELEQKGLIGDAFYPCGKEAAEFLRKMIGDLSVACFVFGNKGNKVRGDCFIRETNLEIEMVRNGWALAHHEGMEAWEVIARENKRGLWRGKFVAPERWRKGERLPDE